MTDTARRIATIRAMEDRLDDDSSRAAEVAAAGEVLRTALAEAQARVAILGGTPDPASGLVGGTGGVSAADIDAARIERGDSSIRSQDAQYQTPDWTRATGRSDLGHDDLFDS